MNLMVVFVLFAPIGVVLGFIAFRFWRLAFIGVFAWLLIEGAFRKWVFPQYQAPILLLKDVVLLATFAGWYLAPHVRIPQQELPRLRTLCYIMAGLSVYCFLELANPTLPSVWLGLYGVKNYIFYFPLILVMPSLIPNREAANKALFWVCLATIPVCLLSIYQFTQPPTSWINLYVSHDSAAESGPALFGGKGEGEFMYGRARTASTFSYVTGLTTFLVFAVPLAGARILAPRGKRTESLIAYAAVVLAIGATFTTGSRTPIFIFAAAFPAIILLAGAKGIVPIATAFRLAALMVVLAGASYFVFSDAASALAYRTEHADDASSRILSPLTELVASFQTSPVLGIGVGSNSNAAYSVGDSSATWLNGNLYEMEPGRVMQDIGLVGFALVYFSKIFAVYLVAMNLVWSRSKLFIAVNIAILAFLVPHIALPTVNNPNAGIMFWGLVGVSLALYRIERRERYLVAEIPLQMMPSPAQGPPGALAT